MYIWLTVKIQNVARPLVAPKRNNKFKLLQFPLLELRRILAHNELNKNISKNTKNLRHVFLVKNKKYTEFSSFFLQGLKQFRGSKIELIMDGLLPTYS